MATAISGLGEPFERLARARRVDRRRRWPLSDVYELALEHTRISPSMLQRRLRLRRARGEELLQELELAGVVGPREGLGSREVLVHG